MPTGSKPKPVPRFTGWWRPDSRSPWHRIVHGGDETDVLNKLLDCVRGGDKCVLPAGQNPNEREQL
jgi:hypothetical protein